MTNRRTHIHTDFEGFGADTKVLQPTEQNTMVFLDVSEAAICSRSAPKSASRVDDTKGFTVDRSRLHLTGLGQEMVLWAA